MTRPAAEADGRRLRRDKNREAVIDALLDLFRDGVYQPSSAQIAARAGLSPRSLFRYFDDVQDLHQAAASRQVLLVRPLIRLGVGPQDPTIDKIRAVVRARARLFEQVAPAARALRMAVQRRDELAGELARNRGYLRSQLGELFAPELAGSAVAVLPAVQVLCSFESYELLWHDQQLSRAAAEAALIQAMCVLLGVGAAEPGR
jgi:AcrR family transcriptional regulator